MVLKVVKAGTLAGADGEGGYPGGVTYGDKGHN